MNRFAMSMFLWMAVAIAIVWLTVPGSQADLFASIP